MWEIENELAAANPAPASRVADLPLADAERELLLAIASEPRVDRRRRPRRRFAVAVAAAGLAAAAVLLAVVGTGDRPGNPEPAFAAELVRFAERSPLLLLDQPGWRVTYANEESDIVGEMTFERANAGMATLNWQQGPLRHWTLDRAASAELTTKAPVLDTVATVYQYEEVGQNAGGDLDITALWMDRGRVLEFRSSVPDMATYKRQLASLERVDANTWLSAMPASVVKAADRGPVVQEMLEGIPLPPGFDASAIPAEGLTKDRYQLGVTVSGTVACTWFQRWGNARKAGDQEAVQAAIAAMATAKRWPIVREMSTAGGYPDVMQEYAAAMPSGRWYGRPLLGDVDSGLGCSQLGVKLP
jgi:hypothetical protein